MNLFVKTDRHFSSRLFAPLILFALAIASSVAVNAVTEKEMDQARAIAAKFYIRYVNDGAGYLDNWIPSSMNDLEKKLANAKDKESLKQFKTTSSPSDFASWDKNQLVGYWSETFFKDNATHLDPKGAQNGMCKKQIRKVIDGLTIAAPSKASEGAPSTVSQAEPDSATMAAEEAIEDNLAEVADEIEAADRLAEREGDGNGKTESSGTWVYIMILAILVGVVVFLVIYASRTMKGQGKKRVESEGSIEEDGRFEESDSHNEVSDSSYSSYSRPDIDAEARMREKYAATLASKSEEIRGLTRQLSEMEALAAKLKDENRRLKAEVEQMRSFAPQPSVAPQNHHHHHHQEPRHNEAPQKGSAEREPKEVYLGRVNSKGIFVRADRHAVDGQSIYKLTTVNGVTGTYALIKNPLIEEQVLDDPGRWIAGGCFAKDIFDTDGREGIRTETPGTAVFKDGAWRVEKKARIRYI